MQAYLKKHGSGTSYHGIKTLWSRTGRDVTIEFIVTKRTKTPWKTDPSFGVDWNKNWGLWNHDVVEAFLQLRSSPDDIGAPYLEVQVSPLGQPFALLIVEPRKSYHPPGSDLVFTSEVSIDEKSWTAKLTVTLPSEIKGDHLYGGFFSCLLEGDREYYALQPNPEDKPDFHRPELFLNLDQE